MTDQGGRLYESDVTRVGRMLIDEAERNQQDSPTFTMPSGGFSGGANSPNVNQGGGGNESALPDPTYTVTIAPNTSEVLTFSDSDVFAGIHLYMDYYRGDPLTTTIFGSAILYILHNGTDVLRCDLLSATGPTPGWDSTAEPPHGFTAALVSGNLELTIAMDNSDAEDTLIFAKPVYRSRA